ncbi:N-acylneuraminate-9-phosphate synthase [Candidatus Kaiserbacteria bacterium CG10_big_fil_rev_8_21_14_0_10_59_10]|uniref:N-acylneuraminate-9-phosphate synthase n=1 Tax=Candidatus Kaiserbacteria bacterium CG10_big_fil_rev_8_21_14_0_10_59_10 TaxID=1974612 RepID=A0A2H0U9S4_9BACT|nr:MAG: N-acylneuraminate-9-phosphate synthase [Candidatus Kaiserbacteria bacterium CG10_big_fil_rev_8_21_14_0_10_59_10]
MAKKVLLAGRAVGEGEPVYIVSEGGLTNWGDVQLAKKQIDAAAIAKCDAIKFQAQTTEVLISRKVSPYWYDRLKYKELSHDELAKLYTYAKKRGIQCFITAHTEVDLDFLDKELNAPFFKVGSGESLNLEFLESVGSRGKPVVISFGLHKTEDEVRTSVAALERGGCREIVILHCNTVYPTPPEKSDLRMITRYKDMFDYPIGYSDHTVGWHIPLAAVALGASMIEKHQSFDKTDTRSFDCPVSTTPEELVVMVQQIRDIEASMEHSSRARAAELDAARKWARQSIVAAVDVRKGEVITREKIALKRPGTGLGPDKLDSVLGKKSLRSIASDELILEQDVE